MLIFIVVLFILIRTINYSLHLNFSQDQALFSIKAFEIYKDNQLTLIGPPISLNIEGRQIFQGSVIYYFQLFFMILGNFDPIKSSLLFMLFCAFTVFPLYYGSKFLINKNAAVLLIILYSFIPYFVDYSRFLWNPNFQFSLLPFLILLLGLFKKYQQRKYLFLAGVISGMLLQFHYQFLLAIVIIAIFFFTKSLKKALLYISGMILGFSPLLLFEIRNNFYNLNTLIIFLNRSEKLLGTSSNLSEISHYFLSLSFLILILITYKFHKFITKKIVLLTTLFLIVIDIILYFPPPSNGFRMAKNWNYPNEEKAYEIIHSQNLTNYNVVNLIYNTTADVQKYLHLKNNQTGLTSDYYSNKYLYVISDEVEYKKSRSYELERFTIKPPIKSWALNNYYNLYLFEENLLIN